MWIYRPYITRNGQKIYAKQYGKKVFRFWVDDPIDSDSSTNADNHEDDQTKS